MAYDKAVDSAALDAGLTSIADAIRTKGGTTGSLTFPGGFAEAIAAIPAGGGDTLTELIDKTMTVFRYDGDGIIPQYIAKDNDQLTAVYAPNAISARAYAFDGCTHVESCDFTNLEQVDSYTFRYFGQESSLSVLHLPKLTNQLGGSSFSYMGTSTHPVTIVLPKIQRLQSSSFSYTYFDAVDLGPALYQIGTYCFRGGKCPLVILRRASSLIGLDNANALTAFGATTTVYIPKALYDHLGDGSSLDYKAQASWKAKAASVQWACIEGSQYETAYADGTPIE